jgi:hypothetical protein
MDVSQPSEYVKGLMLFREIIPVYYENHKKYTNTLCGQNAEF